MRISDWSSDVCSSDLCDRLRRQGIAATVGYFQGDRDTPDTIVQSYRALLATGACSYLSVKAPPLDFNPGHLRAVRSEERRVGKECVRTCRSRWSRYP